MKPSGFEPGKRAVFIRPMNGHNMGKIVELRYRFEEMDRAPVGAWVLLDNIWWLKGKDALRVWVVESMGDPIVYYKNGTVFLQMVGPVPEYFLAPLDDFDQDDDLWLADEAPQEKQEQVTHEDYTTEPAHGT